MGHAGAVVTRAANAASWLWVIRSRQVAVACSLSRSCQIGNKLAQAFRLLDGQVPGFDRGQRLPRFVPAEHSGQHRHRIADAGWAVLAGLDLGVDVGQVGFAASGHGHVDAVDGVALGDQGVGHEPGAALGRVGGAGVFEYHVVGHVLGGEGDRVGAVHESGGRVDHPDGQGPVPVAGQRPGRRIGWSRSGLGWWSWSGR